MFKKVTKNQLYFLFFLAVFAAVSMSEAYAAPAFVCSTGSNLIVNGDAEADQSALGNGSDFDVSGWSPETGLFTVVKYNTSGGYPTSSDPGPANRGNFFFSGGDAASSSGAQTIDVTGCTAEIDAGNLGFNLSGFLGGFSSQNDQAQLSVTFRDGANASLGTATIGPVLASDRGDATGLLSRMTNATVPIGTRTVDVVLSMTRTSGTANDGYADNLSFVLVARTAASVTVGGRIMTTKGKGIENVVVSLTDPEGNVRTTNSTEFGYYRFDDVMVGETYVLSVRGKGYSFSQPSQVMNINEEINDINFIGYSRKAFRQIIVKST
jgi:hypothetical protein